MNDFTHYDRITDILMYLEREITLNFVVSFSRKSLSGEKRFYHYEIAKQSDVRGDQSEYFNIKRNMNFYFLIEIKNDFLSSFILRPRDVQMLNTIIDQKILPWYQSGAKEYAFQIVNDKDLGLTEYNPVLYAQSEIKYLNFSPCVIQDMNDKYSFGIDININGKYFVQMSLDKFMDFVYLLHSDMYSVASTLCNYVKMQPYNVNVFRPFGLGGGNVEDQFGGEITDNEIQASYSSTTINSAPRKEESQRINNFLENTKTKKKEERKK